MTFDYDIQPELVPLYREACAKMPLTGPMEIKEPKRGFNGYLLRCKAPMGERGSDSVLLFAPGDEKVKARFLPDDIDERTKIRTSWYSKTPQTHYASFLLGPRNIKDDERIEDLFRAGGLPLLEMIVYDCLAAICKAMPSYQPFAVVCHSRQLTGNGGVRPFHIHFMVQCVKAKRTDAEIQMFK